MISLWLVEPIALSCFLFYNNKNWLWVLNVSSQKAGKLPETFINLAAVKEKALHCSQRGKPEFFETLLVCCVTFPALTKAWFGGKEEKPIH